MLLSQFIVSTLNRVFFTTGYVVIRFVADTTVVRYNVLYFDNYYFYSAHSRSGKTLDYTVIRVIYLHTSIHGNVLHNRVP